jgi:hypothetical protein
LSKRKTIKSRCKFLTVKIFSFQLFVSLKNLSISRRFDISYGQPLSFKSKGESESRNGISPQENIYLNSIEGSLLQTCSALARPPYETTNVPASDGVIFYALGRTIGNTTTGNSTNVAVTSN